MEFNKNYSLCDSANRFLDNKIDELFEAIYDNINVFELTNAIVSGNKEKFIKTYRDILLKKNQEVMVLAIIANHFALLFDIKCKLVEGVSPKDIANKLGKNSYQISKLGGFEVFQILLHPC